LALRVEAMPTLATVPSCQLSILFSIHKHVAETMLKCEAIIWQEQYDFS
jgi:hypothetical protein